MVTPPGSGPAARDRLRVPDRLSGWLVVALPSLVVAVAVVLVIAPGLAPDVGYWDTGEFQTVLPILGTAHPTGYPTYVILGFVVNLLLFPFGEPAFRMNILSLLCVAVAAGVTVGIALRLTGQLTIALAVGIGLALSPDTWRIATHADPHTLHLAFVAILLALLVGWEHARRDGAPNADRWLVAAAVAFGLSVGNHSLTLLLALPVGLYVLSVHPGIVRRPGLIGLCAVALLGALVAVYLELPLRAGPFRAPLVYAKPETWNGFWYVALAEQFRGSLIDPLGNLPGKLRDLTDLAVAQYGYVAALIPVGFLATLVRHPRFALLTGSAMLITTIFNASYLNADIGRYYLGPLLWGWLWIAVLAATVVEQVTGWAPGEDWPMCAESGGSGLGRAPLAVGLAGLAIAGVLLAPTVAGYSERAAAGNEHANTAARRWVTATLGELEPNALIVSSWSTSTVLWYAQYVDGQRPDVTVIDDRTRLDLGYGEATDVIARFLGTRPVYVTRANEHDLDLVRAVFELTPLSAPATNVYRVIGPKGSGG